LRCVPPGKMSKIRPTNAELQILQVLWDHGPLSLRAIHERMVASDKTGYTSLRKLLQILLEKKLVQRDATTRTPIYRASVKEQETQRQLLTDLFQRAFRSEIKKSSKKKKKKA
jgi:BlaI family transcriptional regulator, penicillinase repressor